MYQKVFQIDKTDNVATALEALKPGRMSVLGDTVEKTGIVLQNIPQGHKVALRDIAEEEDIIKYGVLIGRAGRPVMAGEWVHLHNIHSTYDERSNHLDVVSGVPTDTRYD